VRLSCCEQYERLMVVQVLLLMSVGAQAERDGQHREVCHKVRAVYFEPRHAPERGSQVPARANMSRAA
jgi:hypothetical protein